MITKPNIIEKRVCTYSVKHFLLSLYALLLLSALSVKAQTFVTGPLNTTTLAPGQYYNNSAITLGQGFSASATTGTYVFYISSGCTLLNTAPSQSMNYIMTSIPRIPGYIPGNTGYTNCDVMQTVQYLDGLGRPLQTVQVKGSPLGNDMVQPVAYDPFGREATKYLPYVFQGTADGSYKTDALLTTSTTSQAGFYTSPNTPTGVTAISTPQAVTALEQSPLNRVIEEGAPGDPWQLSASGVTGSGHTVHVAYGTNASNDVILWQLNSTGTGASGTSNYAAGQLYATTTTDENGHISIDYKDKEGHIVCKKAQSGSNPVTFVATYYLYDDYNNLAYVIPPIPATTAYPTAFAETDAVFLNFIYGYHYDGRNRLIKKKIPGKGWEFMVYNTLDQVVMTQDANQRNQAPQVWTFTKYDAMGRLIFTGLWNFTGSAADNNISSPSLAEIQWLENFYATTTNPKWEAPNGSTSSGYDGQSDPQGQSYTNLTINYYDNYNNIPGLPSTYTAPAGASTNTTGLTTVTRANVLGTANMLYSVYSYDNLGRVTQTYTQHYLGGVSSAYNYDVVASTYDFTDFANELTGTTRLHYGKNATNTAAVLNATIANTYVYDHTGRKKQTFESINGGANILLSQNDYNEIGQVMTKHLHSTNNGSSFLQNTSYTYNERGWLSKINDPSIPPTSTKLFAEQLNYNLPQYNATPQFNGHIAEQDYNAGISTRQHVVYAYDPLNRLTAGSSTAGFSETGISYDYLGNIISLTRGANTGTYLYNGSQLSTVSGITSSSYTYDVNGNVYHDGRTGTGITYNMLNLPQTVTATGINITYTYDANGDKLRKVSNGSPTDYISGIQYKPDAATIDFIQTEEGRAINSTSVNTSTNYDYEYTLTDHLGNNRVTFDMATGKVGEDDYYPFGLNIHRQINAGNNYLYNKKELQPEITEYDYGARFYDPVIGRWTSIDPLAESYEEWSPYNYVQNNPIRNIDIDGMGYFDRNGNYIEERSDNTTYEFGADIYTHGQSFTWMGAGTGWIANQQLPNYQLEEMYWNYTNSGQNPYQGAYGRQIKEWSQSWAGFQSGYRRNSKQLTVAKYTLVATSLILGPGAAASTTSVVARVAEDAAPIELNGGIKITQKGLLHVLQRHTINAIAKFASKSKFITTDADEVENLIMQATQHPVTQQSGGNLERIVDAGRTVGVDRATGLPTSTYTVITKPSGELVTAFPGRP